MIEGFEYTEEYVEDAECVEKEDMTPNIKNGESIRSKTYARIFDTDYYWNVPYLIDVEKYKNVMGKNCRMTDKNMSTVSFSCEMYKMKSFYDVHFVLYVWTNNKTNEGEWQYDCYLKPDYTDDKEYSFQDFKTFIRNITDCIIGIDDDAVNTVIYKRVSDMKELQSLNEQIFDIALSYRKNGK